MDLQTSIWTLLAAVLAGPFQVIGTLVVGFSIAVAVVAMLIHILNVRVKE